MDTRSKNYSHSIIIKVIVFALVITCFTGAIAEFINAINRDDNIYREKSYFESSRFMNDSSDIMGLLAKWTVKVNNVTSGTPAEGDIDADVFNKRMGAYAGVVYYAKYNGTISTNSSKGPDRNYFRSFPAYIMADGLAGDVVDMEAFPKEIKESRVHYRLTDSVSNIGGTDGKVYVGFTDDFLKPRIAEWKEEKADAMNSAYLMLAFTVGLMVSFIYLVTVTGRYSFDDKEVHMGVLDGMYNDVTVLLCIGLIALWFIPLAAGFEAYTSSQVLVPMTAFIAVPGLILVLSLVKHIKNGTLFKHSLIYILGSKIYWVIKAALSNGDVGRKTFIIIAVYSVLIYATRSFFPIIMAIGLWYSMKKANAFSVIRKGTERIRNGELDYKIVPDDGGELAELADDINSIADGLNKAVDDEVKSERLKTELITNVSHDIRTPLTSIITYVDLLKNERDQAKAEEYVGIIDQKAQRLKALTDDLFEASKAASGDIPINYEKIDIASLIEQGMGEMNDKVEQSGLDFRISSPEDKLYVRADGKLLWRAIENLLSNILKYALADSRVYVDIDEEGDRVELELKNISAYELNMSPDELMERFKRGDESRSSQGSGLGLSIAKSLVEMQGGWFGIEIDGDLFKAIITMPKYQDADR